MSKLIDLTGQRFGRLVVIGESNERVRGYLSWDCQCDCGDLTIARTAVLRNGHKKSCGCLQRSMFAEKHGMRDKPIYSQWCAMVKRCTNPNDSKYSYYGGKGIKVCDRWLKFENFYADMGDPPPKATIDRIDNNGNYEPENCRWATFKEQCRNRSNNVLITFNGKTQCLTEWSEETGISFGILYYRIRNGWDVEEALTRPKKPGVPPERRSGFK